MVLPIKNQRGNYVGWQHRPHVVSEKGRKYHWAKTNVPHRSYNITSHLKENLELPLAYCKPNSGDITAKSIGLTEGVGFKAQLAANRQQQIVIGAAGGHFASSPQTFEDYLRSASSQLDGAKNVVLYADAGAVANPLVLRSYSRTVDFLSTKNYQTQFAWWDQVSKSVGDIDEIGDRDRQKLTLIECDRFFELGKQYGDWHPKDDRELEKDLVRVTLNEAKIAEKFVEKLKLAPDALSLKQTISEYKTDYGDRFLNLKLLAWNKLESPTKLRIARSLKNDLQQQRVDKIASILAAYLNAHKKYKLESHSSFVQYIPSSKTLTYLSKETGEYFRAKKLAQNRWQNLDSNISQEKVAHFEKIVIPIITRMQTNNQKLRFSR